MNEYIELRQKSLQLIAEHSEYRNSHIDKIHIWKKYKSVHIE